MTWDVPQVFTDEWHKIHFGVFRDKVVLYVNCQPVRDCSIYFKHFRAIVFYLYNIINKKISITILVPKKVGEKPLDAIDARIDLSGKIMIAKEADSSETTPIILQWMLMACDPNAVSRETCGDLPVNMFYSII